MRINIIKDWMTWRAGETLTVTDGVADSLIRMGKAVAAQENKTVAAAPENKAVRSTPRPSKAKKRPSPTASTE
jgi:hypothetical protein